MTTRPDSPQEREREAFEKWAQRVGVNPNDARREAWMACAAAHADERAQPQQESDPQVDNSYTGQIARLKKELSASQAELAAVRDDAAAHRAMHAKYAARLERLEHMERDAERAARKETE